MKITQDDAQRWRKDTLELARNMSLDECILNKLKETSINIIPEDSWPMFYGYVNLISDNKEVYIYESNPSKYFPNKLKEIWNQSGMDHELIGHLYNHKAKQDYTEKNARETQKQMIKERAKKSLTWRICGSILTPLLSFKDYFNKIN